MAKNAVHCGYYIILLWSRFTSLLDLLKHENWTEQTLLTLQRLDVRYIWCANKAPSIHNDFFFPPFSKKIRVHIPHRACVFLIVYDVWRHCIRKPPNVGRWIFPSEEFKALRVISIRFFSLWYQWFKNQSGHENYWHDHTRWVCLIFYQLLPATSVGNE